MRFIAYQYACLVSTVAHVAQPIVTVRHCALPPSTWVLSRANRPPLSRTGEGSRALTHRAVDARAELPAGTCANYFPSRSALLLAMAERIAEMPRFGLALTKKAINQAEDLMGMRSGMDSVFGLHHFAHAHNAEIRGDSLAGLDARSMADAARKAESGE